MVEINFNIIKCVKCNEKFEFSQGSMNNNLKDKDGKLLSKEQETHYVNNRFVCRRADCK